MQRLLNTLSVLVLVAGCRGGGGAANTDPKSAPHDPSSDITPPSVPNEDRPRSIDPPRVDPRGDLDLSTLPAWSERFSGAEFQYGYSHRLDLAVDRDGNVFVAGDFKGALDFGGGRLASAGEGDLVIAKFDPEGRLLWNKRFGDEANQIFSGIAVDPQNNLLITGVFNGVLDFGDGPQKAGYLDMFLAKIDPDGNPVWSKRFAGEGTIQWSSAVAADLDGNVLLTGSQEGKIDYGGLTLATDGISTFALKLDAGGSPLWGKTLGGSTDQQPIGIAATPEGDVVLAGQAKSAVVDGVVLQGKGMMDAFVVKWTKAGELDWAGIYGDEDDQWLSSMAVDAEGNVVLAGTFRGLINFPGAPIHTMAPQSYEFFVAKLDEAGQGCFGEALPTGGAVAVDVSGNVVVAGTFEGSMILGDKPLTSAGGHDVFVAKLRSTGEPSGSLRAGDAEDQRAISVAVDRGGRVILLGMFDGKLDLGGGPVQSAGAGDFFLAKLPR